MDLAAAILTGLGLAAAAGLNAYIPLVLVGVLQHAGWVQFPEPYAQLADPRVLGVLAVLLVIEVLADKIPAVDTVNDVFQTVIRPAAGAVLFAASTGSVTDAPPALALIAGLLTACTVHGTRAAARPVLNVGSGGTAAPVVSTGEDVASTVLSVVALLAPFLVLVAIGLFVRLAVRWRRARRRRRVEDGAVGP
jgi:hypothetical protein